MASADPKDIESLISKLSLESDSKTRKALISLTKLTKNKQNIHWFFLKGGLKRLLAIIQRPNRTIADMALSTLANCALEEESRKEIRRLDGIALLAVVLKTIEKTSILNRTSRALANLAEDELSVLVMEELGIIPDLVKLLTKTSDSDCQQSVLRALRMVCTTTERKQVVSDLDAVKTIMDLLKSEKSALVNCCIRTVSELTKGCNREIAQQVQEYGGMKYIVELANSDCAQVRHSALLSLAHLACHSHVRVCIGSEGGIQVLTQQLKRKEPGLVTVKATEGLCFCCREAINRTRVRESGALELLLMILSSGKCLSLEKKIVTAFTLFYYSEPALEILLNADLVPTLISHLNRVLSHLPFRTGLEDHDDDVSDQISFTSDISSDSLRATTSKDPLLDASGEALKDECFLKKLEETAKEVHVSDSKASGRLSNFKRRMKLKPSPIPTTPPPGLCTIGAGQSVFSFASRQTDTTSLVSVCTSSCSISSLASSSRTNLSVSCSSGVLSSCQVSTLSNNLSSSDEVTGQPTKDPEVVEIERKSATIESKYSMMSIGQSDQSRITAVNSQSTAHGSFASPLSPRTQGAMHHHRGPGHSAMLLLFRISHMTDPSSLLVNKPCIQALLCYLRTVDNPSPKCAQLLSCLALNLLCFKALVVNGAVVAFHHQLCLVTENQEVAAMANECTANEQDWFCTPSDALEQESKIKTNDDSGRFHHMSSACSTQSYCQETGKHLLETFSSQAQTPFGKGVLENLLLKGSKEEREECVLALPLLCRTRKLKQQMLVERKGLRMFCDLFLSAPPNSEIFTTAVESLVVLASDLQVKFPVDTETAVPSKSLIGSDCRSQDAQSVCAASHNLSELHQVKRLKVVPSDSTLQKCIADDQDCQSCLYNDNSFGSHDINFQMDSGNVVSAHKQMMEEASDVFTAMLSNRYLESMQSVIAIPDVSANVFEFAVHHMYGCKVACNEQPGEAFSSASCCCEELKRMVSQLQSKDTKVQFFLELLAFSDRFMVDGLRTVCEHFLINSINATTVVQICDLGLQLNSPQLCVHCLSYLLKVKISDLPHSLHLFKELFLCADRMDVVKQLYQLLLSHLKL